MRGVFLKLVPRIAAGNSARYFGKPLTRPFNLTLSVTGRCNSKCRTCNIWKEKPEKELSTWEWSKILESIGRAPVWMTISGGEPFLRQDLPELMKIIAELNQPDIVTIATNGIMTEKIKSDIQDIMSFYKGQLVVNLSVDHVAEKHNDLRGVNCFDKVMDTFHALKTFHGLNVGIHTVISRYNAGDIEDIIQWVEELNPDSFVCQLAENRGELQNMGMDVAPRRNELEKVLGMLQKRRRKSLGVPRIAENLRNKYYGYLKKGRSMPCFAGIASAHVNHEGYLWACCVRCESIGNLLEKDFKELWTGEKAREIRARIKREKCSCAMANAFYSNVMCDPLCAFL